jgi:glutaredoxin
LINLTIYSRPGCHLCGVMKAVVERVGQSVPITLVEIDISRDPGLEERYGLEIPVLMIDGTKVAKYRIGEDELRKMLIARAGKAGGAG